MFINNNYMCFTHSSSLTSCQLIFSSVPEMLARIYSHTHTPTLYVVVLLTTQSILVYHNITYISMQYFTTLLVILTQGPR